MKGFKKQERIIVYAANGFRIIINKHSDYRNVEMFRDIVIAPQSKGS
jgi:hypothetical protein